jgi:hypothetical protein
MWLNDYNGGNETVTLAGDCLYKPGQIRTVVKDLANFADCSVDSVFDIDEDFALPKARGYFIAGDDLAVPADEEDEKLERLALKFESSALAPELKLAAIKAEVAECIDDIRHRLSSMQHG